MRTQRRFATVAGATLSALALSATAAFAHECFNASRSDTGNANAERGQALSSYDELLEELCPAGDAIVEAAVTELGIDTEGVLVHTKALMAGGAYDRDRMAPDDGHAIDYLPHEFIEQVGAAFGTCFGGPPPPS